MHLAGYTFYDNDEEPHFPALTIRLEWVESIQVNARIDTGASKTVVPKSMADQVGAYTSGRMLPMTDVTGTVSHFTVYVLRLTVVEESWLDWSGRDFWNLEVACSPRSPGVLIGRDVLKQWRILMDGRTDTCSWFF